MNQMSQYIWFDTLELMAVSRNEGSDKPCKCADSPVPLLSTSTKYGYIDADSGQN